MVVSLGLSLLGARTFLRSDTVLRWAPWNEGQPIDLELTSIPVADPVDSGFPAQELSYGQLADGDFARMAQVLRQLHYLARHRWEEVLLQVLS